jgi:hypothetical protein
MNNFMFFATPWWINLLILVPVSLFFYWQKNKLKIAPGVLIFTAIFGIAFAYIESACVIYLRASTGLLPGYMQSLAEIQKQSIGIYSQEILRENLPTSLFTIEFIRELATIVMLISLSLIAAKKNKERLAIFLWVFAIWDIFYYIHLYWTVHWPENFLTKDVLFLIPQPWIAQVWFPIFISMLTLLAVLFGRKLEQENSVKTKLSPKKS